MNSKLSDSVYRSVFLDVDQAIGTHAYNTVTGVMLNSVYRAVHRELFLRVDASMLRVYRPVAYKHVYMNLDLQ